jgi:hypothetical protein
MNKQSLANLALSENGFLFDAVSGNTFTLNSTGKVIMKGLIEGLSREQISATLSENFGVSYENASSDTHQFIHHLVKMNVISEPESMG